MNAEKIGSAIKKLRVMEGYTQQELAEYLMVTDKAVSKWERGLSVPDISVLSNLSEILNVDMDNLLDGNLAYLDEPWTGVLVIKESDSGIFSGTHVYGVPLIDVWLSYFILPGIRQVTILAGERDRKFISEKYGDGSQLGMRLALQRVEGAELLPCANTMFAYGNEFLYGANLTRYFQRAMARANGISVIGLLQERVSAGDVLRYAANRRLSDVEDASICSKLSVMFCPAPFIPQLIEAGNIESLSAAAPVYVELAGRGTVAYPVRDYDDVADVSDFMRLMEKMGGNGVYRIWDIVKRRGFA